MRREMILFGSGNYGHAMLEFLGTENVAFFAHNGEKEILEAGGSKFTVLPFDEYLAHCQECYTIICASEAIEHEILTQLLENHIERFLLWEDITGIWNSDAEQRASKIRSQIGIPSYLNPVREYIKNLIERRIPLIRDSHSEVEFYVVDSFELSHFLPIYSGLRRRGVKTRIVAEPQAINAAASWFDYGRTIELLKKAGIEYSTLRNPCAKVAITTQFPDTLKYYQGLKFQVHYGTVWHRKRAFGFRKEVAEGFDCILTHGEFFKTLIAGISSKPCVVDISYPRYQEFFDCPPEKDTILKELGVNTDKPILVYYPTWDDYSSIQRYWNTIRALRKDFFVISKPHHCTWRLADKKRDLEALYECSDLVLNGTYHLEKTALIADCAICDASSGIVSEIVFLNNDIKEILLLENTDRTEFYVDINQFAACVKTPEELPDALSRIMRYDDKIHNRKILVNHLYSPDVHAGIQRALNAICAGVSFNTAGSL